MASSIIHMAIANELNKKLNRDNKSILIGSIAPDIAKLIGEDKKKSHFITDEPNIPELNKFLSIYKTDLEDDFVLGYYIHLFTDYVWFKYFIPNYLKDSYVCDLNNNKLNLTEEEIVNYIYNDYTNLNSKVIDCYNLELSIFYEDYPTFKNIIQEIPMNRINVLIDNAGIIIKNAKRSTAYLFDIKNVSEFINFCVQIILNDLKDLRIYKV